MPNNTLLTPKELRSDLVFLQSRGFESSDLTRLHHLSRNGRTVSLAQVTSYFAQRATLRGNNVDLAVRCHYVAEQIRAGHTNLRSLVSEALAKWPLKRATRARKVGKDESSSRVRSVSGPRKAVKDESSSRVRSAAKRRKKRARA